MKIARLIPLSLFLLLVSPFQVFALEPIISGTVIEEFDDNIFMNGEREWDFLTTVTLGLGLEHEGRRQRISFLGHINQNLYIRNFDQTNTSQDLELTYGADLSQNVTFGLIDSFAHEPEPSDFESQFGRVNIRRSYFVNDLGTTLNAVMSRHFGMTLRYLNQLAFSMTNLMEDSYGNGAGVNFNFFIDSANTLYLVYDYLHTEYQDGEVIQTHTAGVGYTHSFTQQLSLTLQGGLGCDLSSDSSGVNYSPNVLVSLVDDIDRNNVISLTFTMSHAISRYTSDILENWQISGGFNRQILERFAMNASVFYGQGEYSSTGNITELAGLSLDFTYELTEHITVGTGYTFTYGSTKGREIIDTDYYRDQVRLLFTAAL